jgi:DNA-binding MarR family transcriptional regulator
MIERYIEGFLKELMKNPMSPYKLKVLKILFKKQPLTISEIQRELDISYKETYRHISELITLKYIERVKLVKEKHTPVNITLTENGKAIAKEL